MQLYDYQYIDEKIIGGIEKNIPVVIEILRKLEKKATGKVTGLAYSQSAVSTSQGDGSSETQSMMTTTQQQGLDDEEKPKKVTV